MGHFKKIAQTVFWFQVGTTRRKQRGILKLVSTNSQGEALYDLSSRGLKFSKILKDFKDFEDYSGVVESSKKGIRCLQLSIR